MEFHVAAYVERGSSDSSAIRRCLAAANGYSERVVVFSGRDFLIDEAVLLPSDTTVIIDGCCIKQQDGTFDNMFRGNNLAIDQASPYGYPLEVHTLQNIRITGRNGATLEGPEVNKKMYHPVFDEEQDAVGDYWGYRSHQISLSRCRNFEVSGLAIRKTRGWAMSFDFCENGLICDIEFDTRCKNGDGIDFRVGCSHCIVKRISGHTQDDAVACTALNMQPRPPRYLFPAEPAKFLFKEKDPRAMDIHDISIEDLEVSGTHHAVICLAADGLQVYNVRISNVSDAGGTSRLCPPVEIYTGYGTACSPGDLHDITVENVTARSVEHAQPDGTVRRVAAVGCRAEVCNVTLKNIRQAGIGDLFNLPYPQGITVQ